MSGATSNQVTQILVTVLQGNSYLNNFLKNGYNVVELNYALAPQYRYPIAINQVNQALLFLTTHAKDLQINMNSLVIGGGSAGGNLAGQIVDLATNKAYAKQMGIHQTIQPSRIKAVVFASALLDNTRYGESHSPTIDYLFYQLGRVYFGQNDLKHSKKAQQSNVITYATKNFPPTFVSDGNTGTFYSQAFDVSQKLSQLGIYHRLDYFSKDTATLNHGFEEANTPQAKESMQRMLLFLRQADVK